jgi:hypothetical protein
MTILRILIVIVVVGGGGCIGHQRLPKLSQNLL